MNKISILKAQKAKMVEVIDETNAIA